MGYWSNPLKYQCIPPPPGEIDELRLLGGQQVIIQQGSRSHSGSPIPLSSQLSHVRTQPHQPQPLSHSHAAVQGFMAGAFGEPAAPSGSAAALSLNAFGTAGLGAGLYRYYSGGSMDYKDRPKVLTGGDQGWIDLRLAGVEDLSHNVKRFRFAFDDKEAVSGLHVACEWFPLTLVHCG